MAGPAVIKPSRSDEVLDPDQQLQIANQVRLHFDSMSPRRPTKPNRSEPDFSAPPSKSDDSVAVPEEFNKLLSLQSQVIFSESIAANTSVPDEFVETQYYKELDSVDKQHHATGSGFIKVVDEGCSEGRNGIDHRGINEYNTTNNGGYDKGGGVMVRSNPATNDWIPSVHEPEQATFVSCKPKRSETD